MIISEIIHRSFLFFLLAISITAAVSPVLIAILKKLRIKREDSRDFSTVISTRKSKAGTPIMGGIAIIISVVAITLIFNWHRATTYVPIGAFVLSALLGGIDDLLNIFGGRERRIRTLEMILRLSRVHKSKIMRVWYLICLPWYAYKRLFYLLGSHPGRGVHAHEKILVQLVIGLIVAGWLYFKLGWTTLWLPWIGGVELGAFIIPFIILAVIAMTNAVNITDGIDGLAAGTLGIAYGAYFVISLMQGKAEISFLIATVIGALAGYLLFNISPALYQMGDVASLGMGVLLATVAFTLNREVLLPVIGLIFALEIVSVIFQTLWRIFFGRRLLKMAPLHHHLEISGWTESKIVMYAWVAAGISAIIGIWLSIQ